MTQNHDSRTKARNRKVLMVAYPGVHHLDVIGPLEILATTQFFIGDGDLPYDLKIVAAQAGPVKASSGLTITAETSFAEVVTHEDEIDTLMVAGGHGSSSQLKNPQLLEFMQTMAPRAKRVVSICTGALILAEAGLLKNKRASTHWFWCPIMENEYPDVTVDREAIYVRDGRAMRETG